MNYSEKYNDKWLSGEEEWLSNLYIERRIHLKRINFFSFSFVAFLLSLAVIYMVASSLMS